MQKKKGGGVVMQYQNTTTMPESSMSNDLIQTLVESNRGVYFEGAGGRHAEASGRVRQYLLL